MIKASVAPLAVLSAPVMITDVHVERPPFVDPVHFEHHAPIHTPTLHWNEDPHSVPEPLSGNEYLTST